jgi:formylmethanofuran dehydrogenase subunit B
MNTNFNQLNTSPESALKLTYVWISTAMAEYEFGGQSYRADKMKLGVHQFLETTAESSV